LIGGVGGGGLEVGAVEVVEEAGGAWALVVGEACGHKGDHDLVAQERGGGSAKDDL
jgi:hypothetical protein